MYQVYWLRNGMEFEKTVNEKEFKEWLEWVKKHAWAYGYEKQ